ncbi:MAG: hypothetical protein PHH29_17090 [Desulfuromonadaceae bacterium]|nr:hypothetical protein [Desulfuromonadaceae bacterium]
MTQEQAQELLATVNGKLEMKRLEAVNLLFREIDELKMMEEDAQQYALKCRKELEELMKPKSCEGCKLVYYCEFSIKQKINNSDGYDVIITIPRKAFYCSKYEPKEQL